MSPSCRYGGTVATEGFDRALGASYQLEELIGRGAAGEVWRGIDRRTDEPVAAKLLRSEYVDDHELVARFLRERTILVGLRHPNIVAVRDLVAEGDRLAIVMEYVDGGSLRRVVDEGPLPARLALQVTTAALSGLAVAHERGVLHRDLKPDNILLTTDWRDTAPDGVKLSDFGVSSLLEEGRGSTTGLVGTPEYMAPELLLTGSAGREVDVYGAGVLLYELLAGRTPFAGPGTGYVIAHRHVTNLAPRLPVPDQLWNVLERLLDKDPDRRPTAADAIGLLQSLPRSMADLPALESQEDPAAFVRAAGPLTEVRGLAADEVEWSGAPEEKPTVPKTSPGDKPVGKPSAGSTGSAASSGAVLPDLGERSGETVLRTMPAPAARTKEVDETPLPATGFRGRWRELSQRGRRTVIAGLVGVLVLALALVWLFTRSRPPAPAPPPPVASHSAAPAQQQSKPSPTGLGVARSAVWDAQQRTVELTVTYSAQRVGLQGPFLEVLPNVGGTGACPEVTWEGATARRNLSSATGIDTPCAWSVLPGPVPARDSVSATATIALPALGNDPSALQEWLQTAGAATDTATSDSETTSTAYPAQRLTDVQVVAPDRIVTGKTLRIRLLPVWPSGVDQIDPMLVSPPSGRPSQTLTAAAGGLAGVKFSDGCSGALSVSEDDLVVVAQSVSDSCQVDATVGNFTDLHSNVFSITTRGS